MTCPPVAQDLRLRDFRWKVEEKLNLQYCLLVFAVALSGNPPGAGLDGWMGFRARMFDKRRSGVYACCWLLFFVTYIIF